jgi:hypothetical protein
MSAFRIPHQPPLLRLAGLLWVIALLTACGGGSAESPPATQAATANSVVPQTDLEIATLIYSDSQRTPAGFNLDTDPAFWGYVSTTHLKTRDLNASAVLQYELCSDDYNQALSWSETANSNSGDNASLLTTSTTDAYFQFDRLRNSTPQGYLRQRVYRCSYLSRNTVDLLASEGDAGILNVRPLDASTLQALSEYLWQFTSYNNFGNVVLLSRGTSGTNVLRHTLYMASLTPGASCDTITLNEWQHTLDTTTGDLSLSITPLSSFGARQSGNSVSLC